MNKVIIFCAPSGSGKTTIVKHLLQQNNQLMFSVSACTRNRREGEVDGKDYYFLTKEIFAEKVKNNEFLEYEEVYGGNFYGTLKAEIERIWALGKVVLFDVDVVGGQGTTTPGAIAVAAAAGDAMAQRKMEDERYALFSEAAVIFLDLPDAVFRGYEGDEQLLGRVRDGDVAPVALLAQEIARLEPQQVYFPLGIGSHVDHQLARKVGAALLAEPRKWEMPGPDWASRISFYEDFPYAWWSEFNAQGGLPAEYSAELPADVALTPEIVDTSAVIETKIKGISLYESQTPHLFGSVEKMADAVRGHGARVALDAGRSGSAERYWSAVRR